MSACDDSFPPTSSSSSSTTTTPPPPPPPLPPPPPPCHFSIHYHTPHLQTKPPSGEKWVPKPNGKKRRLTTSPRYRSSAWNTRSGAGACTRCTQTQSFAHVALKRSFLPAAFAMLLPRSLASCFPSLSPKFSCCFSVFFFELPTGRGGTKTILKRSSRRRKGSSSRRWLLLLRGRARWHLLLQNLRAKSVLLTNAMPNSTMNP